MMYVDLCILGQLLSELSFVWTWHRYLHLQYLTLFQVLGGCISGSQKLVSVVRNMHHVLGGTLNPVS